MCLILLLLYKMYVSELLFIVIMSRENKDSNKMTINYITSITILLKLLFAIDTNIILKKS